MTSTDVPVVVLDDRNHLRALADLRWRLDRVVNQFTADQPVVIVDLSGLSRLSSAALAVLLRAQRSVRRRGGTVLIRGADDRHAVLTGTSLHDRFTAAPGRATRKEEADATIFRIGRLGQRRRGAARHTLARTHL